MIAITNLNDQEMVINPDFIECIVQTPDTIITLTTGRKIIVKEVKDEVIEKIIAYKRSILQ